MRAPSAPPGCRWSPPCAGRRPGRSGRSPSRSTQVAREIRVKMPVGAPCWSSTSVESSSWRPSGMTSRPTRLLGSTSRATASAAGISVRMLVEAGLDRRRSCRCRARRRRRPAPCATTPWFCSVSPIVGGRVAVVDLDHDVVLARRRCSRRPCRTRRATAWLPRNTAATTTTTSTARAIAAGEAPTPVAPLRPRSGRRGSSGAGAARPPPARRVPAVRCQPSGSSPDAGTGAGGAALVQPALQDRRPPRPGRSPRAAPWRARRRRAATAARLTVVSRSSASRTGTGAIRAAERVGERDGVLAPRARSGRPACAAARRPPRPPRARRPAGASRRRCLPVRSRRTVSTGVARMPSGSLAATPIRTLPTSTPRRVGPARDRRIAGPVRQAVLHGGHSG